MKQSARISAVIARTIVGRGLAIQTAYTALATEHGAPRISPSRRSGRHDRPSATAFRRIVVSLILGIACLLAGSAQALVGGRNDDTSNLKNVGIFMFTYGPNDLGPPSGTFPFTAAAR